MGSLTDSRLDLVEALSGPYGDVLPYVPENWNPPLIMLSSGNPYLVQDGATFDPAEFATHLEVLLIAAPQENRAITPVMDDMITHVVLRIDGWQMDGVEAPFITENNRINYLACRVSISRFITLTESESI